MTNILLTGGAGFIGFHTTLKLLQRGDAVIVIDNFNDYYDLSLKESRAKILQKYKKISIVKADISDMQTMEKVFNNNKIDKICHLAAQAGVRYSIENPFVYERTNLLGTLVLLELCKKKNIKDFIFASSSSVYGNNKKMPFYEIDRVDTPISLYAATKKFNEEVAYVYHHLFGLNCTGLRFFTVYGPYGRPDMALFKFTKNILEGKHIDVYNNGDMKRDFTYIDDIVAGVISSIDKSYPFEIFNLARGESILLMDFIKEIELNLNKKAKMNLMNIQPGDVPETSADITMAAKKLGYSPKTSIKQGVKNFINWYKEYYIN